VSSPLVFACGRGLDEKGASAAGTSKEESTRDQQQQTVKEEKGRGRELLGEEREGLGWSNGQRRTNEERKRDRREWDDTWRIYQKMKMAIEKLFERRGQRVGSRGQKGFSNDWEKKIKFRLGRKMVGQARQEEETLMDRGSDRFSGHCLVRRRKEAASKTQLLLST